MTLEDAKANLWEEFLKLLRRRYPDGLYEYLYKQTPELYRQLLELEHKIDVAFLDPHVNEDQFMAILKEYWLFHDSVITEFRRVGSQNLNIPQIRRERNEKRCVA